MEIQLLFETHSSSRDNESGIATGWLDGTLSERGRIQAAELGLRRRDNGIQAVFTSDLGRAIETAAIAFGDTGVPVTTDWRLRECNYGMLNGASTAVVHGDRRKYLDTPYPGGESWRQAITRVGSFIDDLSSQTAYTRILVIGHAATRWAFDHLIDGVGIEELLDSDFGWREGWEFRIVAPPGARFRSLATHRP